MRFHFLSAAALGHANRERWSSVLTAGGLYGVLELRDATDIRKLGVALQEKLLELFETDLPNAEHIRIIDQLFASHIRTLLLVVPTGGSHIHILLRGEGSVYLRRGSHVARIVSESGQISGEVQPGDILLLVSQTFQDSIDANDYPVILNHDTDIEKLAEKLRIKLQNTPGTDGAGALFLGIPPAVGVGSVVAAPESPMQDASVVKVDSARISSFRETMKKRLSRVSLPVLPSLSTMTPRRRNVAVSAVIIGMFFLSVFLGIRKQSSDVLGVTIRQQIDEAQYIADEGIALLDLNPVKGRERLKEAQTLLETVEISGPEKTAVGRQYLRLRQSIDDNMVLAMQIVQGEPEVFYDVSLVKSGAVASSLAFAEGQMAVVDSPGQSAFLIDVLTKNGKLIAGGNELRGARRIATDGSASYALTLDGIRRLQAGRLADAPTILQSDEWGTIESMVSYGGNIYLLDTQKSRIWKYVGTDEGFSDLREYLNPDTLPDLSRANALAIDGSVWVSTNDGKIIKFSQGRESTFILSGIEPALGNDIRLYTDEKLEHVYILDKGTSRVVVVDKEGMYVAQYVWEGPLTPSDFVVSAAAKKILLLIDGTIYGITLR